MNVVERNESSAMLLRIGLIAYPIVAVVILASQPGPVGKFVKAGATSPERARRPSSLGIERTSLLADHVRSGVLHRLADGRYYVELPIVRRRRKRVIIGFSIVWLVLLSITLIWLVRA